jgi:hypothetical protein
MPERYAALTGLGGFPRMFECIPCDARGVFVQLCPPGTAALFAKRKL